MAPGAPELHPDTPDTPRLHGTGNVLRHVRIRRGDPDATADVVVSGEYEVGMQDQAFLGPESGLAVPDGEGGVDLYIATQWLHVDQDQVAASRSACRPRRCASPSAASAAPSAGARTSRCRSTPACSPCTPARPVRMAYNREESFYGHVHRHPCTMRYEHGATRDGRLVFVRARIVLDGGAYASSSTAVCANAGVLRLRALRGRPTRASTPTSSTPTTRRAARCAASAPCRSPSPTRRRWTGWPRRSTWTPSTCGSSTPWAPDSRMPTGQRVGEPAPVAELLERVRAMPMPPDERPTGLPGGVANVTHGEGVRRGVGYGDRDQERRLLGGLRRLLDRARAAVDGGRRAARRGPHRRGRGRPGHRHRPGPDRAHRARRRARGGARRRHAGSARRDRARPRARPTSPAARSRPRARRCASAWRSWRPSAA